MSSNKKPHRDSGIDVFFPAGTKNGQVVVTGRERVGENVGRDGAGVFQNT